MQSTYQSGTLSTVLSLQHLTVTLGSRVIMRDVHLDVQPKDLVCIIGEEGSGKTMLLKLLTRELQPTEGAIKVDGAYLSQLPREVLRMYRQNIGYLDEDAALDPALTIEQNVGLGLDMHGTAVPERERAVTDLLKRLHLSGIANKTPNEVSRGERRLAAFARSIASSPLIILLDEPFQGMSNEAITLATGMLENMRKKGATIIVTSAQERTIGLLGSARVTRLQRGKLTEEAPVKTSSSTRAHAIAQTTSADIIERAHTTPAPVVPEKQPEPEEKKKIKITAVGSL